MSLLYFLSLFEFLFLNKQINFQIITLLLLFRAIKYKLLMYGKIILRFKNYFRQTIE